MHHKIFFSDKKFPTIEYWLPHLGWYFYSSRKVYEHFEKTCFLTSTKNFSLWMSLLKLKNLKIKYASDHPFNSNTSLEIFSNWKKV